MASLLSESAFVRKHQDKIQSVLSCFDRVIFRGYLPLSYPRGIEGFLYRQKVLLKDFKNYAPTVSARVKEHVRGLVEKAGAPFRFLAKRERMEQEARRRAEAEGIREGIVCGFAKEELCRSYRMIGGKDRPRLKPDYRRCTVLYVYVMHATLGLIHVKLETWLPLTMQVYGNGHDFVARKLEAWGVRYQMHDNAFILLEDPKAAQAAADLFVKQKWPKLLGDLARQFNPLLGQELEGQEYYWVMDQAEYATDVLFTDAGALASLYPRLVEHARTCLSAEDVLKFLGRKLTGLFQGEVQTHIGRRLPGVRVVHRMKSNALKMYDKGGIVLRLETVINDPTQFRVRRWRRRGRGRRRLEWQPLRKGVAWLWRYAEVSRAANARYLEALAAVDDDGPTRAQLDRLAQPAKFQGQPKRALAILSPADQALFKAVLRGEHRLRGFTNRDLAQELYRHESKDAGERRRRCGRVTRLIQLLRAHRLVAKVPRSRRYRVTPLGERLMATALYVRHHHLPNTLRNAA